MLASSLHYPSPPPPQPIHPLIPNPRSTHLPLTVVSAKSSSNQDFGVLGRTILTELKSNPKQQKQKKKQQDERSQQISGSQVLLALQKAAAVKRRESQKLKKKKKIVGEGLSSAERNTEEEGDVECGEVRQLCLRSDWGGRLDELEKRLQELKSIIV